jgi:hypothetical protein
MIPALPCNTVIRLALDLAEEGAAVVVGAHMRINKHERLSIIETEDQAFQEELRFRFDVLEIEMNKAFDQARTEALASIAGKFVMFGIAQGLVSVQYIPGGLLR